MCDVVRNCSLARALLAALVALTLALVPVAGFAQAVRCHAASARPAGTERMVPLAAVAPALHGHKTVAAETHDDDRHGSSHRHDKMACCGGGCTACTPAIANSASGTAQRARPAVRVATIRFPLEGLTLAPPLGPPRSQA